MNVERLTEIAEWLEAGAPHKGDIDGFGMVFVQSYRGSNCGTVCCIGGATNQFFGNAADNKRSGWDLSAGELLGLTQDQADELFMPTMDTAYAEITADWAARTIRHLIATGEVDWEATRSPS